MPNEKRLIDANKLKWKLGQVTLYVKDLRFGKTVLSKILESYRRAVFEEIDEAPTVDAVKVVRCEKCLYRSQYCDENGFYKCGGVQNEDGECFLMVEPTHFCAFGKWRGKLGARMDGERRTDVSGNT